MSTFIDVPDDLVENLLAPTKQPTFYDEERPDVPLEMCEHCGACADPKTCVWSVQCPKCCAPPRQPCTNDNGGVTGLHEERHSYANSPYWREYRG